jgi:hypothetical protein
MSNATSQSTSTLSPSTISHKMQDPDLCTDSPPDTTSPLANPSAIPVSPTAISAFSTPSLWNLGTPRPILHNNISIIWHNVDSRSNFTCFRKESCGPIERILVDFARALETGVFEQVLSVNASQWLFCVTVAARRNREDGVMDAVFMVL